MSILDTVRQNKLNAEKAKMVDSAARDNEIKQSAQMLNEQYRGLAAQEAAGLNQTKSDLAKMILSGDPASAVKATEYANSMNLFNPIEMKGLAAARMEQDMGYGRGR